MLQRRATVVCQLLVLLGALLSLKCTHSQRTEIPPSSLGQPPAEETTQMEVQTFNKDQATEATLVEATPLPALVSQDSKLLPSPVNDDLPWQYTGILGPEQWGHIKPEYKVCSDGQRQSPVNLVWSRPMTGSRIEISSGASRLRLIDTGRLLKTVFDGGTTAMLDGVNYALRTADLHSPSEHTLSGLQMPLEWQLNFEGPKGEGLIASIFLIEGEKDHTAWEKIVSAIPPVRRQEMVASEEIITLRDFLPKSKNHYRYEGSLTTPPCHENITWVVFNTPVRISRTQIAALRRLYDQNARPIQKLNGRTTRVHTP